ncbi:MAG TPA: hypothetical protein VJQ84_09190 [Solirubrobacterales bacterium]|nr:hypothetical protein [Solirubrobacterales bacterium]
MSADNYEIWIDVGELSEELSRGGWRPVAEMVDDPDSTIEKVLRHCEGVGADGAATILRNALTKAREMQEWVDRPFVPPDVYVIHHGMAYWLQEGMSGEKGGLGFCALDRVSDEFEEDPDTPKWVPCWEEAGDVDWHTAFATEAEAAPIRAIEAALQAIAAAGPDAADEPSP